MKSLLVISNEPALAETLASELHETAITATRAKDAGSHLHTGNYDLVVIDNDTNYSIDTATDTVRLVRPVKLNDAIYTILQRLKSKTMAAKEGMELTENYILLPSEKLLRSRDGKSLSSLTEKEVKLLQYLIEHEHETSSRDALLKSVWGYGEDINTHTLETHIYRLRNKVKQMNPAFDILFLEEGGYRLKK